VEDGARGGREEPGKKIHNGPISKVQGKVDRKEQTRKEQDKVETARARPAKMFKEEELIP